MGEASARKVDGRNTAVFSLPMAKESGQMAEISCKFPKKSGWRGFFLRARDPFPNITVPRFLWEIWETYKEVTATLRETFGSLPYPTPDHPIPCECPVCLHALENLQ